MLIQSAVRAATCILLAGALGACVTLPPNAPRSPQDPWESWNRGVYKVNDALDRAVAKPVAKTYVRFVPHPIRLGVSNFFDNLRMPTVIINDTLEGKLRHTASDLGRFLLNTTLGVGGLLDPATQAGLAKNHADFGLTLGIWGVPPGPFVEIPVLGPSDLRDAPGYVVDTYTNPAEYIHNSYVKYSLAVVDLVDIRAGLLSLEPTLQSVYDPYAFVRDAYLHRRAFQVSGVKEEKDEDSGLDPDAPDAPANAAKPAPVPKQ
jgi:phospholipid-binding lipoprotein MlaA